MPLDKVLYTAKTHTTGGRDGASQSDDGRLAVKLSLPGIPGSGTNPEQLFAAGWSACFLSSIRLVAGKRRPRLPPDAAIDAEVDLGTTDGACILAERTLIPRGPVFGGQVSLNACATPRACAADHQAKELI